MGVESLTHIEEALDWRQLSWTLFLAESLGSGLGGSASPARVMWRLGGASGMITLSVERCFTPVLAIEKAP
jgi:hypothetical protein